MSFPFQAGERLTAAALNAALPQSAIVASSQTISSTSPAVISGFSFPVSAGSYFATVWCILDAASGGTGKFRFTGPTASMTIMGIMTQQMATLDAYQSGSTSNGSGYNTGDIDTPTLATAFYITQLWGTFVFSDPGTLALEVANGAGASDTFEIYTGSWMQVQQALG
jgi:hypothetical protein